MNDAGPVVVGIDFSDASRRALELAAAVSARAGAPLDLVHVWNPRAGMGPHAILPEPWLEEQRGRLTASLEELAEAARGGASEVRCRVVEGAPSRTLADAATGAGASLLVVGRRGAANLAHVLLGSVSERIVHLARCPVLVVPRQSATAAPPDRLLVGVDFSRGARDAYAAARALAERLRPAKGLLLVHAQPGEGELWLESWSELAQAKRSPRERADLERWAEIPEEGPLRIKARVVEGVPEQCLLDLARSDACDWLVIGVRGRTALQALLVGSTTDRLLKRADRPVVVVPQAGAPR